MPATEVKGPGGAGADGSQPSIQTPLITHYTYDAIHWRAKKQTGASGKLYWYDVNTGEVLMETALDGSAPREFIYFGGQRVARRNSDGTVNYRFLDHLGSLRVMTSDTGAILQELDYDAFGYSIAVVSNPTTDDPYQFISKERDAESLNDHYWFRQYSPRLGRWCSADPLGGSISAPQSLNRYSYVLNDPTNFIDPLGLEAECAVVCTTICFPTDDGKMNCQPNSCTMTCYDDFWEWSRRIFIGSLLSGLYTPPQPRGGPAGPRGGERLERLKNCALAYYGIDPLSVSGLAGAGKWALIAAAAGGIPKAVPEFLGMRVISQPGSSGFTSLLSMVSVAGGGGTLRTIANFGSKVAVPIAIASAVIDATAIGICTALD